MAFTTAAPANSSNQSYTEMDKKDVDAIGAHCQMAYCGRLDLLPFKCESCRGTFCLDHRSETSHKCPKAGEWARRRNAQNTAANAKLPSKPSLLDHDQQCANLSCKTLIYTSRMPGNHCTTCNRHYCLSHRMQEDHDCKNLKPIGARPKTVLETQREQGMAAFRRLKLWAEEQRKKKEAQNKKSEKSGFSLFSKSKASSGVSASVIAEQQALKRAAKGDEKVPAEKRIYLYVEASADTTKSKYPSGKFFYNKEWSVGKVLDAAAKSLQVQNVNNRGGGEEDKLRVFHVEGGKLLNFGEKIGERVKTGDMIVLLRGVGDPNLIDL